MPLWLKCLAPVVNLKSFEQLARSVNLLECGAVVTPEQESFGHDAI